MAVFTKRKYLTKIRSKNATFSYNGHLRVLVCDKCRIKDGLSTYGGLRYGICSFCGRKERVSAPSIWTVPTVANPKTKSTYRWKR